MTSMVNFDAQNLALAGKDYAFPKNSILMNELCAPIFQANKQETTYDLLDDETGLVSGSLKDFQMAAQIEKMNSTLDNSYDEKMKEISCVSEFDEKCLAYMYDANDDGYCETEVYFNLNDESVVMQRSMTNDKTHTLSATYSDENNELTYKTLETGKIKLSESCFEKGLYEFSVNNQNFNIVYDEAGNVKNIF